MRFVAFRKSTYGCRYDDCTWTSSPEWCHRQLDEEPTSCCSVVQGLGGQTIGPCILCRHCFVEFPTTATPSCQFGCVPPALYSGPLLSALDRILCRKTTMLLSELRLNWCGHCDQRICRRGRNASEKNPSQFKLNSQFPQFWQKTASGICNEYECIEE
ncbi:hypothetical protein CEXT_498591 [Caerostris extrusa]|uniref:Uncharacterized protein n=1 Tax=Caerostris extrusa TaxID=172846 RepID=A0AAV4TEX9_CAEEX|nr:hypothetical protein CEXT_498591 [Caerostris extrusa]